VQVWIEAIVAGTLGGGIGLTELVSRYRDKPTSVLRAVPALVYVGLNFAISLAAFWLTPVFGLHFGPEIDKVEIMRVFVAGLGAMAFFRSSLFTVRIGEQDVAVGPGSLLQILLDATDREVDRLRAQGRAREAVEAMKGVSFEKAHLALPMFCGALLQNFQAKDQAELAKSVSTLRSMELDESTKVVVLGLLLSNYFGPDVVRTAVTRLGSAVLGDAGQAAPPPSIRKAPEAARPALEGAPS
jgi:hypothetical protein